MAKDDVIPSGIGVGDQFLRCAACKAPYEERKNLLNKKMMWFPTCVHPIAQAELVEATG